MADRRASMAILMVGLFSASGQIGPAITQSDQSTSTAAVARASPGSGALGKTDREFYRQCCA
jgi:hypothetical protein